MCFSNDVQTLEIPRRRVTVSSSSSSSSVADDIRQSTSRPVNRQLELPGGHGVKVRQLELPGGHGVKGPLRSPLTGPRRVSTTLVAFI